MEYFPNYPPASGIAPGDWARAMEARGWDGICASDHLWVGDTRYPHVFVAATAMACATSRIRLTTSFANNLFRSPVEFAQASLSLAAVSGGRFEAGLGAGWAADEIEAMGGHYPPPGERISRYVEALQVVRPLLATGQCRFDGDYYRVDISGENRLADVAACPPPLIASAGGPRALREVTPLVDRVELKASARATRVGHLDFGLLATVTEEEVRGQVARVRDVSADVPMSIFLLVGCGTDSGSRGSVDALKQGLGDRYLGRFLGDPGAVAEALEGLESLGISRVQLTELVPGTLDLLAGELKGDAAASAG